MRLLVLALLLLPLAAQTPPPEPPKAAPAKPAQPPDLKAFTAAAAEKDPPARAAALDKFLQDYPSSPAAANARRELVTTLVKLDPAGAVLRTRRLAEPLPPGDAAALYRQLAADLKAAGRLPEESERAARRALKLFKYPDFAAQARAASSRAKRPAPDEAQLKTRFAIQRAQMTETLAQIRDARGDARGAGKLYREALQAHPALSTAALSLAAGAAKSGRAEESLGYLAQAMLARPVAANREKFYDAWRAAKGSPAGAEEYLDQRYRLLFPPPVAVAPYRKPASRSNRVVLAEVYTGAGCPPCVGADLAFDAVLARYPRTDVAVVMYHEHIPRPDPLTNSSTIDRWRWQKGRGVPTYAVDGQVSQYSGGGRESAPELESHIRASIEKQLQAPARAGLELQARHDGRAVRATARVSGVEKPSADLVLHLALVEKEVRYSGENGIRFHPMVVRSLHSVAVNGVSELATAHAFSLDAVAAGLKRHLDEFEKYDERHNKDGQFRFLERKDSIHPAHLAVVAYIQDSSTREVLQAAFTDAPQE